MKGDDLGADLDDSSVKRLIICEGLMCDPWLDLT